ncbi:MAG TPA: nucleoside transporter C-terminal domain-containing protein [Vicinamibacteria bacterium]|nr:nucleoside transporter C-terminal domain-containing protein [Vicinamibacteria bacterium]
MLDRAQGLLGVAAMLLIAYLMSRERRRIDWRLVASGVALQAAFGVLVLKTGPGRWFFERLGDLANALLAFSVVGSRFAFGYLVDLEAPPGVPAASGLPAFAFRILPIIIFLSSLSSVLYYLGWMQKVVKSISWVMLRSLRTSGAETLCASANIFLGQTEAPLLIRPYLESLTHSELVAVMTAGFATMAAGVMTAYAIMLQPFVPGIAGHLLAACAMNAVASLVVAKMLHPETEEPRTRGTLHIDVPPEDKGLIDAAARGAATGMRLVLNIAAMLIAFIALVALLNAVVDLAFGLLGVPGLTLQAILGQLLRPLAWLMGVPWHETAYVGGLIGLKVVLNEFVAYLQFSTDLGAGVAALEPRSAVIASYALVGFANVGSIAIQIGGLGALAPGRQADVARFGLRAMVGGNLAAFLSASLAGVLV